MSMDDTLQQAYELVEADKLDEARSLLEPLLESQPDNPDLWWIYSHAVTDAEAGQRALNRVQELSPNYPGLASVMERVTGQGEPAAVSESEFDDLLADIDDDMDETVKSAATVSVDLDDEFDFDDVDAETTGDDAAKESERSRSPLMRLVLVAIVVLLLVVVAGVLLNGGGSDDSEPTQAVAVASATVDLGGPVEATEDVMAEATEETGDMTAEATEMVEMTEEAVGTEEVSAVETAEPTEAAQVATEEVAETEEPTEIVEPTEEPPTQTPEPTVVETEEPTDAAAVVDVTEDSASVETAEPTEEPTEEAAETEEPTDVAATETPEPTEVPPTNTVEPTDVPATATETESPPTDTPEPTQVPATDTPEPPAEISAQTITEELPDLELYGDGLENIDSELGATTLVAACTGVTQSSREILSDVMNLIVAQVDLLPDESDAVGVRLVSCDDDTIVNLIAVPVEVVQAFNQGDMDQNEFIGQWRAIREN